MPQNLKKVPALWIAALLVTALPVWPQAYGRVVLRVKDTEGKPVEGARVTVTCREIEMFHEESETNKKGRVTFAFADATKFYDVKIEKERFAPLEIQVKAELRTTTEREITLRPRGEEVVTGEGDRRLFSPSERVFNEGVDLLRGGDLEAAKLKFLEALEKDDKMAAAHSALAAVHAEQENYDETIAAANRFLEMAPPTASVYVLLYDAYRASGRQEDAERALEALAELGETGDTAVLIYNEGVEALKSGNAELAMTQFKTALEIDPEFGPAQFAVAKLYLDEGSNEEAAEWAEKLLAKEPTHSGALAVRYEAYRALDDPEKEEEAFRELAAVDPAAVARGFYDRGVDLFNSGDIAGAIEQFERVLQADPRIGKAHYHLGLSYVNTGDPGKAREHLQKFLEMSPDDPDAASATEMIKYLGN
jgi:tetratricopeptide (TPR) repeat protein